MARLPIDARESKSRAMLENSRQRGFVALFLGHAVALCGCEPNLPPEVPVTEPAPRVPSPVTAVEGQVSRNLLQSYIDRDPVVADSVRACPEQIPQCDDQDKISIPITWEQEAQSWSLPYRAKRLVAALMITAAHDRIENLRFILTPDAQWGWPSTYRIEATPIFAGDGGEKFFAALRRVGERLPEKTKWVSQPAPPGVSILLSTGAEPMWTYYLHDRTALLMHLVLYQGAARIDYVGMFEQLPDAAEAEAAVQAYAQTHGAPPPFATPLLPPPEISPKH